MSNLSKLAEKKRSTLRPPKYYIPKESKERKGRKIHEILGPIAGDMVSGGAIGAITSKTKRMRNLGAGALISALASILYRGGEKGYYKLVGVKEKKAYVDNLKLAWAKNAAAIAGAKPEPNIFASTATNTFKAPKAITGVGMGGQPTSKPSPGLKPPQAQTPNTNVFTNPSDPLQRG